MKGAFFSEGEVLLFLHCDTTLPPNAIQEIQNATKDNKIIGGGFLHSFDKKKYFLRNN